MQVLVSNTNKNYWKKRKEKVVSGNELNFV